MNTTQIFGVNGKLTTEPRLNSKQFNKQVWISERRRIRDGHNMFIKIRFDDDCKNGHNSFSITGYTIDPQDPRDYASCGCIHDDIALYFPEFAHLIKWHLTSSESPMHYAANTMYAASDRDHNGKRKGEPIRYQPCIRFNDVPLLHKIRYPLYNFLQSITDYSTLEVVEYQHEGFSPNYSFNGLGTKWHEAPFETRQEAEDFREALIKCKSEFLQIPTSWSEGKERDLDAARRAAVWLDAPDEILCADPEILRTELEKRLPDLMAAFRRDIFQLGFRWENQP